jgi:hypothetical protein
MLCEIHNIRFCFLPENSTHLLQPLDVAVFGPMKRLWRTILSNKKEEGMRAGENFASIPKQQFPGLLKQLMDHDFSDAIRSGFESCGLYPFNPERGLSKLPKDNREVESNVQKQLLEKLSSMRYNQPANKHAKRPSKKDKLPAGASYTCLPGMVGVVGLPIDEQREMADMAAVLARKRSRIAADQDSSDSFSSFTDTADDIPLPPPPCKRPNIISLLSKSTKKSQRDQEDEDSSDDDEDGSNEDEEEEDCYGEKEEANEEASDKEEAREEEKETRNAKKQVQKLQVSVL